MRSVIVERDGSETITIFGLGEIRVANSDHPNFAAIKAAAVSEEEVDVTNLKQLFDVREAISRNFQRLTTRVSLRDNQLFLDMEPIHSSLTDAIVRFMRVGEDFKPLVNFLERLANNPNPKSVEALYTWLSDNNFTITPDGMIVGYKGVSSRYAPLEGEHKGVHASMSGGHAYVDGIEYGAVTEEGNVSRAAHIPYPIGSIIEMPRSEVVDDSGRECSQGIHVGTYTFAKSYASPTLLEVHVDPRDVVSVPASSNSDKIRVCRLLVVDEITGAYETPLRPSFATESEPDQDDEYDEYEDYDEDYEPDEDEDENEDVYTYHPGSIEFINMIQRARRRRQSVVPYIEHMTAKEGHPWKYLGEGEVTDLTNWSKNSSD